MYKSSLTIVRVILRIEDYVMNQKSMGVSIVMLVLSLLVFTASSFAWFALSDAARVDPFVVEVNNYDAEITFQISKNGGAFQNLTTQASIAAFMAKSLPSDYYNFNVSIENASSTKVTASIYFNDITSHTTNPNFDMRDVFFITGGTITLNASTTPVPVNSSTPVTKHGVLLSNFRLSNIINGSNDITIIDDLEIALGGTVFIEFGLTFQSETEHIEYQAGILTIGGLYVVFDT